MLPLLWSCLPAEYHRALPCCTGSPCLYNLWVASTSHVFPGVCAVISSVWSEYLKESLWRVIFCDIPEDKNPLYSPVFPRLPDAANALKGSHKETWTLGILDRSQNYYTWVYARMAFLAWPFISRLPPSWTMSVSSYCVRIWHVLNLSYLCQIIYWITAQLRTLKPPASTSANSPEANLLWPVISGFWSL